MSRNQLDTIYPCPFSKGYGIPVEQAWSLLKVFFVYRFITALLFIVIFYSSFSNTVFKIQNFDLFTYFSHIYFLFVIISGLLIFKRIFGYTSHAQITIFSDIVFITLLMHASGGIDSGIGILLVVSIAAGGLLIGGRCAILFAALASLAILTEQYFSFRLHNFNNSSLTYAGILGASFFTTAYLAFVLAQRAEQSQRLASEHQETIFNLEELNQYIIQHLRSGIIISNSEQQIKMSNEAALNIIGYSNKTVQPKNLLSISRKLSDSFASWLNDMSENFTLIKLANGSELPVRFSLLNTLNETFHMIILEDISLYNQRLQQNKLASLGRLSASIAHEIRNPLGAISHASQLLSEAPRLSTQDQRLTEIIHSHCERVNQIIENVLQLSKRHPSKKEKIKLKPWIENFLDSFINQNSSHREMFAITDKTNDIFVYMDSGHLKQILDNLLTNALKYGDITSHKIIIEISFFDNLPCVTIMDNGTKIDPETASQLFEPFFTTSASGIGLGLFISKELAELNQANLSYAVTRDNKNSFKLCLPNADNSLIEI